MDRAGVEERLLKKLYMALWNADREYDYSRRLSRNVRDEIKEAIAAAESEPNKPVDMGR